LLDVPWIAPCGKIGPWLPSRSFGSLVMPMLQPQLQHHYIPGKTVQYCFAGLPLRLQHAINEALLEYTPLFEILQRTIYDFFQGGIGFQPAAERQPETMLALGQHGLRQNALHAFLVETTQPAPV